LMTCLLLLVTAGPLVIPVQNSVFPWLVAFWRLLNPFNSFLILSSSYSSFTCPVSRVLD
jgi:hypothetical protein